MSDARHLLEEGPVADWLAANGLVPGRNPTQSCPFCGAKPSSGNDAVVVDEDGVCCFRCKTRRTWMSLLGSPHADETLAAARALVHYPHQRLVLRSRLPNAPESLLRAGWLHLLRQTHPAGPDGDPSRAKDEELIRRAASNAVPYVRSAAGQWLTSKTLAPHQPGDKALAATPAFRTVFLADLAKSREVLNGFVGIEPLPANLVLGPYVTPRPGTVFARRHEEGAPPPIALGRKPPLVADVEAAWRRLEEAMPGVDRNYVEAAIAAVFFAQRGDKEATLLVVTGPPGSGKTSTLKLAAAAVGGTAMDFTLGEPEPTLRKIGLAMESGACLAYVDELGRVVDTYHGIEPLLRLNGSIGYRALYANECRRPLTLPIVLAGSTLPAAVLGSPELSRRCVGFRLSGQRRYRLPDGLSLERIREDASLREALDLVTAWIWWAVRAQGATAEFRSYALTHLGGVELDSLDISVDEREGRDEVLRRLYDAFRSAPDSELTKGYTWRGWLDVSPGTPHADLLEALVDTTLPRREAGWALKDLERLHLAPILGFDEPQIALLVHFRGSRWLLKFVQQGVMRGKGMHRRSFPPARVVEDIE